MGTNTLNNNYTEGSDIEASHTKQYATALNNAFVGRNNNNPAVGQSLGTPTIPWGTLYANALVINGQNVDVGNLQRSPNRIISGATLNSSNTPDFLRATSSSVMILGSAVNLILDINNISTTIASDIAISTISNAPSTNNTAMVNGTPSGDSITIDNAGSEITALVGQQVAFKTDSGEIITGFLRSETELVEVKKGFFLDTSGDQVSIPTLADNDNLTLLRLGWIFIADDGSTNDVSYKTPITSYDEPDSPDSGDYWFDTQVNRWKRYSGSEFVEVNRILIGVVVADDADVLATRSADFNYPFSNQNNVELRKDTNEIIKTDNQNNLISVYGNLLNLSEIAWNITTDLVSGLTEANDTTYYLYLSRDGQSIIDTQEPILRRDLQGYYHPIESWRAVGEVDNDSSGDFEDVQDTWPYNINSNDNNVFKSLWTGTNNIHNAVSTATLSQSYKKFRALLFRNNLSGVSTEVLTSTLAKGWASYFFYTQHATAPGQLKAQIVSATDDTTLSITGSGAGSPGQLLEIIGVGRPR